MGVIVGLVLGAGVLLIWLSFLPQAPRVSRPRPHPLQDLLTQAERIYSTNYRVIELLMVAGTWYLLLTTIGTVLQNILERRLSGSGRGLATSQSGDIA